MILKEGIKLIFLSLICIICVRSSPGQIRMRITRHTVCAETVIDLGEELNEYIISLIQCAEKCFLRSACVGLTYKRAGKKCSLFLSDEIFNSFRMSETPNINSNYYLNQCVLIQSDGISLEKVSTPIHACNLNEEYDIDTKQCIIKECPIMHFGATVGNNRNIDSRLIFTCESQIQSLTHSTCLKNGLWNPTPPCGNQCLRLLVPAIPDDQLSASSFYHYTHGPDRGRLDITESPAAWCSSSSDTNPFIQVEFDDVMKINGMVTKGRSDYLQYVTSYTVSYSPDCSEPFITVADSNRNEMIFTGNFDADTEVVQYLPQTTLAKCVRLHPITYVNHRSMRFDIIGCSDGCYTDIVSGPYGVTDIFLTASNYFNTLFNSAPPSRARLDTPGIGTKLGGWIVEESSSTDELPYIQVKFRTTRTVARIITQGVNTTLHPIFNSIYTSTYTVAYSDDCTTYHNVTDGTENIKIFTANNDWFSKVVNTLPEPISALCFRITPISFNEKKGLRFDLKGCIDHTCPESENRTVRPNVYANFHLRISSGMYNNMDAVTSCISMGAFLVDLSNPEIRQYVTKVLYSCSVYPVYGRWWIRSHGFGQACVGLSEKTGLFGIQEDSNCEPLMGYICQWTV